MKLKKAMEDEGKKKGKTIGERVIKRLCLRKFTVPSDFFLSFFFRPFLSFFCRKQRRTQRYQSVEAHGTIHFKQISNDKRKISGKKSRNSFQIQLAEQARNS